eukprot:c20511_g1_i1 orf=455-3232(+)
MKILNLWKWIQQEDMAVYKAFDDLDGIEVAWNQVNIQYTLHNSGDMERLYSELHLLKMLKHQNIIKFCNSWVDPQCKNVNFITEIFTSGTLRQYRRRHKHVKLKAIKHWSRQILQGLVYLHSHDPPIIHRDLKCDNIFINGNSGEVKIGDLGLAVILSQAPAAHSVIGTPEFMAPELYEEHYNELVDIYSFGMCLLEILTFEYPYSECTNAAQIYRKVTLGKRPAALDKVKDPEMRKFVEKCLASASERLHAKELLIDPFLQIDEDQEVVGSCQSMMPDPYDDLKDLYPIIQAQSAKHCEDASKSSDGIQSKLSEQGSVTKLSAVLSVNDMPRTKIGWKRSRDFRIKVKKQDEKKVIVRLRMTSSRGGVRYIQFDFELETDTAASVASEMVTELDLSNQDSITIAGMIDTELANLLPDWRPGGVDKPTYELVQENPDVQELRADDLENPSVTSGLADDLEVAPDSRTEVLVYGRFEEVGCNASGSHYSRQEQDGLGFSDFSSEHFECGESDLSLDASFDRLNAETSVDDRTATRNLEGISAAAKMEPSIAIGKPSFISIEGESMKECLPFQAPEQRLDGDIGPEELRLLVLQQKQELELLQSKHARELLDLKMHRNEEAQPSTGNLLPIKQSSLQVVNGIVQSSVRNEGDYRNHIVNEINEAFSKTCKDNKLDGSFTAEEVSKNLEFYGKAIIDKHSLPESSSAQMTANLQLQQVMAIQDSAVNEGCENTKEPVDAGTSCDNTDITVDKAAAFISFTPKEFGKLEGELEVASSGIANQELIESKSSGVSHLPRSTTEPDGIKSIGLPRSDGRKLEAVSLPRRESYLEFYKAGLTQKDKTHLEKPGTSDGVNKSSDSKNDDTEQVRKWQLQESIADLEARTLEGFSRSSSSYLVKSAGKSQAGVQHSQPGSTASHGRLQMTSESRV